MAITGIDTIDGKPLLAAGALSATSANIAFYGSDGSSLTNVMRTTNIGGTNNIITGYNGSAFSAGTTYEGIAPVVVDNTAKTVGVSSYEVSGVNIDIIKDDANGLVIFSGNSAGRDWTPEITAASANATAVTTAWVTAQGYSTAGRYVGISPIVVDNTANEISADTAVLTAESPIYIETTTADGVEINTIKFSGNTGGNSFSASVAGDTIDYSGASALRANFYNYEGRTAASSWGYFNSITLYPEGGSTAYGNTTFTFPNEFGYEGLIYRNGNQYKYIPFPYESAFHTSTSGLEMTGTDTKRTYFLSGPDTKFSIDVPKHTTIELHYQGMMDIGNIKSDTIMGFEFTNSPSTADTASNYLMATAEIILPTIKEVATTASLGDSYNTYTAIDAPVYRRTYSTYMRYDNTSNYDQSLYMRVAPYIMGSQGWNTASWLKIGQPQPHDNIYYKLIPDFN